MPLTIDNSGYILLLFFAGLISIVNGIFLFFDNRKLNKYLSSTLLINSGIMLVFDSLNKSVDGQPVKIPKYSAIDIIGIIYKNSLHLECWHVNVRVTPEEDISKLEAYRIPEPKTPSRVWA